MYVFKVSLTSSIFATASSAAADGVGALKSATKSAIVKSVSCPTADIIGISELNIALATISSLNGHKSSIDPPPLPIISTSANLFLFISSMPSAIFSPAPLPCTGTGYKRIFTLGFLLVLTFIISLITAPVFDVKTPIVFGINGIGFLYFSSNKPSLLSLFFSSSYATYKSPRPSSFIAFAYI